MRKIFLTIIVFSTFVLPTNAQDFFCLTPEMNKKAEILNPEALSAKEALNNFTKEYTIKGNKEKTTYIIPVVFHVVHNYGPENISKEQILDAIRIINEDFRKRNADTSQIIPEFKSIAADCNIEFRLAKIDPNGNCTDGINRVVSPLTYNANENTKLAAPSWDRTKYLNVWTVASIESGAAGYAYYPSSVHGSWGDAVDGVLMLASYVGSIGTSNYNISRVLTHEIGHYLNLMHTWGNSNNPGLPENCYDDDQVSDTPNTIGHTSCNLYAESCGSLDNVQNFMEYTYCYRMFTEGQKLRMHAALNSHISGRNNLWTTANLIATGVHSSVNPQICPPIADFTYNKKFGCAETSVQFKNYTWNTDSISSLTWQFPGGNPSVSNDINPVVTYSQAGLYSATLTATNPAGSSTITKNNIIQILDENNAYSLPWFEGFENYLFPQTDNPNLYWFTSGTGQHQWQRTTITSYSGIACLIAKNNLNANESQIELYSPNILINGQNPANIIKFKLAYAQKDENTNDKLQVFVSFNCGETWYPRLSKAGANLQTVNGTYYNNFVPTENQWREEYFSIGAFLTRPFIRLKFVATSNQGNPIYIDNIQLDVATSSQINEFDDFYLPIIYPNPVNEETKLWIKTTSNENLSLIITDILGKNILTNNFELYKGENSIQLPINNIKPGIYFIKLVINNNSTTLKMIVP
jgi:PKD repeat protein